MNLGIEKMKRRVVKYFFAIALILLNYSCSSRKVNHSAALSTERELKSTLLSLMQSIDELKFDLDEKRINNFDPEGVVELEEALLTRNMQLIKFIHEVFSKRKSFSFSTKELAAHSSLKVVFSNDKRLCSFSWDSGLGGTMDQHILICQFQEPNKVISSKILYAAGMIKCKQRYNCIATSIRNIAHTNAYFLLGTNQFESNTNGESAFFLAINSGKIGELSVLKYTDKSANYFFLKRDLINNSYTIELEDEILLEKRNLTDIYSVNINTDFSGENKLEIFIQADKAKELIWRNDQFTKQMSAPFPLLN
jgi:hypothetical protein